MLCISPSYPSSLGKLVTTAECIAPSLGYCTAPFGSYSLIL